MRKCLVVLIVLSLFFGILMGFDSFSFAQRPYPKQYNSFAEYKKQTGKEISKFNEAPMLAELVKQGKLPPVEQRLPKDPVIIEPLEEIGQYGGTWRRAMLGVGDRAGLDRITWDPLVRFDWDNKTVVPNLAERWKVTNEGKVFTFYLRRGVKWSDGKPFTADDILFWYQDILLNKDITPVFPVWMTVEGSPGTVEKVDDYTVRFTFPKSYGAFLIRLAGSYGCAMYTPKYYLSQFHPKYTPMEKLNAMTKDAGFTYWYQLFSARNDIYNNPELPTLRPWKTVTGMVPGRVIWERNPYYWKIDIAGNQLPYIDRIVHDVVENIEVINLKAVSGEIDMQHRHITWENYPLFIQNQSKGDYRVLKWKLAEGSNAVLAFNLNHKDPVLRSLFQNKKFRIALSLAINREEINQICYLGLGEPSQITIIPGSPYYVKEAAKLYTEYDPRKANQLLDQVGLSKRDKDGFRLRPDGKRLEITIEFAEIFGPYRHVAELVSNYWNKVGVKTEIKIQSRELCGQRWRAGEHDVGMFQGDRGWDPFPEIAHWLIPKGHSNVNAPQWGLWYETLGKQGEEPTDPEVIKAFNLEKKIYSTTSEKERILLGKQLVKLGAENVWKIGLVGVLPGLVVVKNNFRNVIEDTVSDYLLRTPGNAHPEQFFIKR